MSAIFILDNCTSSLALSTESDEQLNSPGNQIGYYEDFIRKSAAREFISGYIDEGLSGISTKRRENFNRMIDDAEEGKFDLIITKGISRFVRNTLDSIRFIRRLLIFENHFIFLLT